jgi:hypothetical protein
MNVSGRGYIDCKRHEGELIANVYQLPDGCTWYGYGHPVWADIGHHSGVGYRVRIKPKSFADRALAAIERMLAR